MSELTINYNSSIKNALLKMRKSKIKCLVVIKNKILYGTISDGDIRNKIKNLLSISLNLAIRAAALNVALYLANSFATKYGSNYIAAQTIAFQIWLFFAFFIINTYYNTIHIAEERTLEKLESITQTLALLS